MKEQFGPFKLVKDKKTTMKYGFYYDSIFSLSFANDKRHIRVWLPENYEFDNPNKRFPVIYFSDGQNMVNRYLSAYGDWEADKTVHRILKQYGVSCIIVGMDCPKSPRKRAEELCPPYPVAKRNQRYIAHPAADKTLDFFTNELKPLIDSLFNTIPDREHTAVGGSSMGGIFAFYGAIYKPETFGFSLCYSPAFFLYGEEEWMRLLQSFDISTNRQGKLSLYVGGKEFEHDFVKTTKKTYKYLKELGFDDNRVLFIEDETQYHNEKAWAKHLYSGISLWLKDLKE